MANPSYFGQTLIDQLRNRLGAAANAYTVDEMLDFLNAGKDSAWAVLASMGIDYFVQASQSSTSTGDDYIVTLDTATREYSLPKPCREIRAIECTTEGYKDIEFIYFPFSHGEFQSARKEAAVAGSTTLITSLSILNYSVVGRRTLIFAEFPPANITIKVWYVAAVDDFGVNDEIVEVAHPYVRAIVNHALQTAMLNLRRESMSSEWLERWKESVREIALSAFPRSSGPIFVEDFVG